MKPKKLSQLPDNTMIFIDANIFLSEILEEKNVIDECIKFLDRTRNREITPCVSIIVLNEVFHRTLIADCIKTYNISSKNVLNFLKTNPNKLKTLKKAWKATSEIKGYVEVLTLSNKTFDNALKTSKKYGLLSNDAMHVEVMKAHEIKNIATNDSNFERVKGIKLWKP